jgi:hypothetical protein
MAIIKPEYWKGMYPYWWEVTKTEEDRLNNKTKVTLSLYFSSETFQQDNSINKTNNKVYDIAVDIDGTLLKNDEITSQIVRLSDRFTDGTDTDNSYDVNTFSSPVYVEDPNPDPTTGYKRTIEGISYLNYFNANLLVLSLRVHFFPDIITINNIPDPTDTGHTIQTTQIVEIPDPENSGQTIQTTIIVNIPDPNYVPRTIQQIIKTPGTIIDPSLDRNIAWVVDNFSEIQPGIGEFTYFKSLLSQMTIEEVFILGIQYGIQKGHVDKRLSAKY